MDECFQRTNLGRRLYKRLEERFREDGVRMVIADTEAENKGAIAFFGAIGFSPNRQHVWLTKTLRRPIKRIFKPNLSAPKTSEP